MEMQKLFKSTLINFLIGEGYDNEEIQDILDIEDIDSTTLTSERMQEFINDYRLD